MPQRHVTAEERELIRRAHSLLPGGSVGNVYNDVIVRRGKGSHVWDVSGNEYVDYVLGSGPMVLGHAHPEIVQAVAQQLEHGSTFFATHELAIQLAAEIVKAMPCADQVRFTSSGTEATNLAMRAARTFRRRDQILKFEGGFHGMNDYALMSMAPSQPASFPVALSDSAGIPAVLNDQMLIAPFNDLETTAQLIERHHDQLAAVIMEPFQRVIPPRPGFLRGVRVLSEQYVVPLIFDEVVTGFRFAYGGAQEYYGVVPDMCTLGKILAGGFPLAAVAGRADLMRGFEPPASGDRGFMPQIGTLNGNPVAAAAGLATLNVLRRDGVFDQLAQTGRQLMDGLSQLLAASPIEGQVVGEPWVFDVIFTDQEIVDYRSAATGDRQRLKRFNQLLLANGIFRGDTKFYVSLAHTQTDIDRTIEVFSAVIEQLS